jgi:hypothetical protein
MKRSMPRMSMKSQSLNPWRIIKIKSFTKIDKISFMKRIVIILLVRNKKKSRRLLIIGKD